MPGPSCFHFKLTFRQVDDQYSFAILYFYEDSKDSIMAKVSAKRQITLPVDQCISAHINAGDDVISFVDRQGVISIVKKQAGAAKGILKNIPVEAVVSAQDSLESAVRT